MNGHGGRRSGAGRPAKWSFEHVLNVGLACEAKWREASFTEVESRLASQLHADKIRALQKGAQAVPVSQRRTWLASEAYEEHSGDIEALLHDRARTRFDHEKATFESAAPRCMSVSAKPPRGTRQGIIREVATAAGLSESAVDNLWQEFRRFERELRKSDET